jgi:hypothetical protein
VGWPLAARAQQPAMPVIAGYLEMPTKQGFDVPLWTRLWTRKGGPTRPDGLDYCAPLDMASAVAVVGAVAGGPKSVGPKPKSLGSAGARTLT